MQTTHFRHLFHLLRVQIILLICCATFTQGIAQPKQFNMVEHDIKPFYFGITLAYNQAHFQLHQSDYFLKQDSIAVVEPITQKGFDLGLLGTMRLNNRIDLRANPTLIFADKNLYYAFKEDTNTVEKKIQSVLISFPLQLKFKSDRIGNFRVYAIGGLKYDFDLASNASARKAEDMVKISKSDLGYEAGIGFEFYFPDFIFAPELKLSNGFRNILVKTPDLNYSNVIEKLKSRMIIFSIHLEG